MAIPAQQQQRPLPPNVDSFFGAVTGATGEALREAVSYTPGFNKESGAGYIYADNLHRVPLREINANKPEEFSSPDGDKKWLHDKSGYTIAGVNTIHDTVGKEKEKEKEKEEKAAQYARNIMTTAVTVGVLNEFIGFQRSMMAANPAQEIKASQMMYVDPKTGRPVSADAPGAQQVSTREEKAAIEAKGNECLLSSTAEDRTKMPDGRMLNVNDAAIELAMKDRMAKMETAIKDMEAGKTSLKDYPEDMQQSITYWQENGKDLTAIQNKPPEQRTPDEKLRLDESRDAFLGQDKPKVDMWAPPTLQSVAMYDPPAPAKPAQDLNAAPQMQTPQLTVTAPAPAPPTNM